MPQQKLPIPVRSRSLSAWVWVCVGLLPGCTSYEAEPIEPLEILRALDAVGLSGVSSAEVAPVLTYLDVSDGLTLLEASAVAVRRNPALVALRADLGVAEAQLVQAGLLADPVIGWDAMDAVAGAVVDGKVDGTAWTAGFGLTWDVPRPGEIDAKEGVARAAIGSSAARLASAEWLLVRDVQLAYVRLLAAGVNTAQTQRLAEISLRSLEFFERAREAGAATALEEGLARVASDTVHADLLAALNEAVQARQALNGLLGLPPDAVWETQDVLDQLFVLTPGRPAEDVDQLVRESLDRRPDLRLVLADYQQAEEQLRLEVSRQWPQLQIGTSISLQLPIFSQLNQPAIETALRRRDASRARVTTAVQQTRGEIHAALSWSQQADSTLELFETRLGPQTEETLRLTEMAFEAREVTPLEILTAQRQVLVTQARFLAARRGWVDPDPTRQRVRPIAASCSHASPPSSTADDEESP